MFIPNKTYQAIKVGVLGVISALLLIISAELVLYITLSQKQNEALNKLSVKIDSLENFSNKLDKTSAVRDNNKNQQILKLLNEVEKLQSTVKTTNNTVNVLVKNQCTIIGSDNMDERLSKMCSP